MTAYYLGSKGQGRLSPGKRHWMGYGGVPFGCEVASLLVAGPAHDPYYWPPYDNAPGVAEYDDRLGGGGSTALLPWEGRIPTKAQLAPYRPPRRRR